jgi:hypothetical protein
VDPVGLHPHYSNKKKSLNVKENLNPYATTDFPVAGLSRYRHKAIGWTTDKYEFDSRQRENFIFSTMSIAAALGPTESTI